MHWLVREIRVRVAVTIRGTLRSSRAGRLSVTLWSSTEPDVRRAATRYAPGAVYSRVTPYEDG